MATLNFDVTSTDLTTARTRMTLKSREAQLLIEEFLNSGKDVAELVFGPNEYKTAQSIRNLYDANIKRMRKKSTVAAIQRGNRCFLLKLDPVTE